MNLNQLLSLSLAHEASYWRAHIVTAWDSPLFQGQEALTLCGGYAKSHLEEGEQEYWSEALHGLVEGQLATSCLNEP